MNQIVSPTVEQWKTEWFVIESVIQSMNLALPDYEKDRQEIIELLERGEYVMHHSPLFELHYSPHYRIIERTIFDNEIRPFLEF